MKCTVFFTFFIFLFLVITANAKEYKFHSQFDPASVQWSKFSGNAMVAGMGIYREPNGVMKTCARDKIIYYPYSSYVLENLQARIRGITHFKNLDSRMNEYAFSVNCDESGDFKLFNIPAGKWIFVMNIPVVKEDDSRSSYESASDLSNVGGQGNGILYRIIVVTSGKITQVPLIQGDVTTHE